MQANGRPADCKPLAPVRTPALGDIALRQHGDGHRAFALPVDLREARAEAVERAQRVLDIHRRTAPDDGADMVGAALARMLDQPLHHGGGGKHRCPRPGVDQRENLVGIEAAGFRHHVDPGAHDIGDHVEAGAVAHRRCMQQRIAGRGPVDLIDIGFRHGREIAMRQHRALRPAGGAGGVEQPGEVVRLRAAQRQQHRRPARLRTSGHRTRRSVRATAAHAPRSRSQDRATRSTTRAPECSRM